MLQNDKIELIKLHNTRRLITVIYEIEKGRREGKKTFVKSIKIIFEELRNKICVSRYLPNFYQSNIYYSECKEEWIQRHFDYGIHESDVQYAKYTKANSHYLHLIYILSYIANLRAGRLGVSFWQRLYSLWKIHFVLTLRSNWMFCSCVSTWVRCSCRGRET